MQNSRNSENNNRARTLLRFLPVTSLVILVLLAVRMEFGSVGSIPTTPRVLAQAALWVFLILLSVVLYRLLLSGDRRRMEARLREEMGDQLHGILDDARLFRFEPFTQGSVPERMLRKEQERLCLSSVMTARSRLKTLMEICERSLSAPLHSFLLYFSGNDYLILREARSGARSLARGPVHKGRGIFGIVQQRLSPVTLTNLQLRPEALPYYRLPENISVAIAFPILLQGEWLGVLVADRSSNIDFSEEEKRSLAMLSDEVAQVIGTERLLLGLRKEKFAYERFLAAAHAFNRCSAVDEVALTTVSTAQEISGMRFAAMTVRGKNDEDDRIVSARWNEQQVPSLIGKRISSDSGLVAKSMKLGCALPESPYLTPQQKIFDSSLPLRELAVARVFPLLWKGEALGTLVLGDSDPDRFLSAHARQMIDVISGHAAAAVAQTSLYQQMETMAATDGLTGLFNHRVFQNKLAEAMRRAARYRKNVSLLLIDLDHFKQINDRFGHPLGDRVLQAVANLLTGVSRGTDVVARYGGEEFAIIMEETDPRQAAMAAGRIRETLAARVFESAETQFHCTLSIGVASFPEHASDPASLVAGADQALYRAKHEGRNRVSVCAAEEHIEWGKTEVPDRLPDVPAWEAVLAEEVAVAAGPSA